MNDQRPDRFARHDAVYLLGALAPEERQEYVDHLRTCATCSRSVADLAGLPGLLARVPPDLLPELGSEVVDEPPPTLLPTLLVEVQRTSRRRHRWALAGGVAAAAAVVAVLALGTLGAMRTPSPSSTSTPPTVTAPALTLAPVAATPIRASAQLQPVAWGTRIVLRCTYAAGDRYGASAGSYALVVRDRTGRVEQVATWNAVPGQESVVSAATALQPADISGLEVRTASGDPVLRATT